MTIETPPDQQLNNLSKEEAEKKEEEVKKNEGVETWEQKRVNALHELKSMSENEYFERNFELVNIISDLAKQCIKDIRRCVENKDEFKERLDDNDNERRYKQLCRLGADSKKEYKVSNEEIYTPIENFKSEGVVLTDNIYFNRDLVAEFPYELVGHYKSGDRIKSSTAKINILLERMINEKMRPESKNFFELVRQKAFIQKTIETYKESKKVIDDLGLDKESPEIFER